MKEVFFVCVANSIRVRVSPKFKYLCLLDKGSLVH